MLTKNSNVNYYWPKNPNFELKNQNVDQKTKMSTIIDKKTQISSLKNQNVDQKTKMSTIIDKKKPQISSLKTKM